jgi:hypothetical protein
MAAGDGKTRGYHISALYAPVGWPSWGELAAEFLEARKSRQTLQMFVNSVCRKYSLLAIGGIGWIF